MVFPFFQEMHAAQQLPCLIVMDINMPKLDGKQTFVQLQADSIFSNIPVVVFSTSSSPMDKLFFQSKGARFYKPSLSALNICWKLPLSCWVTVISCGISSFY